MFLERGGRQVNVTGKLSESDYARFLSLVSEVERATVSDDSNVYWDGLLAEGPVSHPRVILKFCHNENQTCVAGEWFLKIIDLLTPYMHQFYADVEGSTPAQ